MTYLVRIPSRAALALTISLTLPFQSCMHIRRPDTVQFSQVSYPDSWDAYLNLHSLEGEFKHRNSTPIVVTVRAELAAELAALLDNLFSKGNSFEIGQSVPDGEFRIIEWRGMNVRLNNVGTKELSGENRTAAAMFERVWKVLENETINQ